MSEGSRTRLKALACPHCGEGHKSRVDSKRAPRNEHPDRVTLRRYICGCGGSYVTEESRTTSSLADLSIVGRSKDAGARSGYSRRKFDRQFREYVPKGLTEGERIAIVNHIEMRIEARVQQLRRGAPNANQLQIDIDSFVRLALEGFADAADRSWHGHRDGQARVRAAHAQYALATLGSVKSSTKWRKAEDFLSWLTDTYPHLQRLPGAAAGRQDELTEPVNVHLPPHGARAHINTVVKNTRFADDPPRRMKANYEEDRVRKSLERALRGRDNAEVLVDKIYRYVVAGLVGQNTVRTSQLSAMIAEALRGMDEIAYLRWVAIGKELELEQLHAETVGLIDYPSPRLMIHRSRRVPVHHGVRHHSLDSTER